MYVTFSLKWPPVKETSNSHVPHLRGIKGLQYIWSLAVCTSGEMKWRLSCDGSRIHISTFPGTLRLKRGASLIAQRASVINSSRSMGFFGSYKHRATARNREQWVIIPCSELTAFVGHFSGVWRPAAVGQQLTSQRSQRTDPPFVTSAQARAFPCLSRVQYGYRWGSNLCS